MSLPQNLRMLFEKILKSIEISSSYLVHPIDSWSKNDVQKWIEFCIDEYSLGDVNLKDFEMNGKFYLNKKNNYQIIFFIFIFFYL